jgi:23S rRNA pseudouridine1911/1915/1917 synthase
LKDRRKINAGLTPEFGVLAWPGGMVEVERGSVLVTLLERLRDEFPDSSGRRLRTWLVAGRVRVGGEIVRDPRTPVSAGDRVTLGPAPPPALASQLRLIHEDDSILVIEKPPGLLTIGTEHERERTAYRMVWAYLKGARPPRRPFIVHRLDRETSGLLVVAKTPEAQARLQGQFAAGNAERRYAAIVEGVVTRDEGMLRDVLIEERSLRVRPADPSRPPPKGRRARIAITWYRVTERRADVTRLAIKLGTGRRHQIRVQLAKLGHPVVGDVRHGARRDPLRRLCLHATRLGFRHPDTGAPVEFDSAPPAAFASVGRPAERSAPSAPPTRDRAAREPGSIRRRTARPPARPAPFPPPAPDRAAREPGSNRRWTARPPARPAPFPPPTRDRATREPSSNRGWTARPPGRPAPSAPPTRDRASREPGSNRGWTARPPGRPGIRRPGRPPGPPPRQPPR